MNVKMNATAAAAILAHAANGNDMIDYNVNMLTTIEDGPDAGTVSTICTPVVITTEDCKAITVEHTVPSAVETAEVPATSVVGVPDIMETGVLTSSVVTSIPSESIAPNTTEAAPTATGDASGASVLVAQIVGCMIAVVVITFLI